MEWAAIVELILAMIADCLEKRRREEVEAGLLHPGMREYRAILRGLRDKGDLHGRDLRAEADECMEALREADAEDIECLLDDAAALTYDPTLAKEGRAAK